MGCQGMGKDDQYCTELSVFCIVLLVLCEATGPYAHADKDGNRTFAIFSLPRVFCCLCSKFFVLGSDSEQTEAGEWAARTAWHHGHWSNEWSERFFRVRYELQYYNTQQDVSVLAPEGFPVDLGILHVAQGAELEADECDVWRQPSYSGGCSPSSARRQGGVLDFQGLATLKKTRYLVKSCSTAYGHPLDNILKEIAPE